MNGSRSNQQAEAKAVAAGDHDNAGWRAYQAGWVHYLREQADAVLACADRAAAHWQTAQAGARERAFAIRLRGLGHQLKADYPAAIAAYREALDLYRSLSAESEDVAIALNDLADAEQRLRRSRGGGAGLSRGAAGGPRGRLRRGRGHLHGQSG